SLTVVDAKGRSDRAQKTVQVTPGSPPAAMGNAPGRVQDPDGHPPEGVTASPGGGGAPGTPDPLGQVHPHLPAGSPVTVSLSKDGFADQVVRLELPATTGADADFEATLAPRDAAQTLPDAAAGGALDGRDGARITFPAGALIDGSGAAVSGPV